ncbi:hypothetical protein BDV59DRAFT_207215 [Aspergillus ambiguus]|uniref:EthD domain-containing protein n=1 Tax=Aspergillus ambiguus TaxID=176160 RepID=UPI003CCD66D8
MPIVELLVALRRKAGMMREEFLNYHYQVHGSLSTGPSPSGAPLKYFQTHFVDTAYHEGVSQKVPNAHPVWAFIDDITELYFSSTEHMSQFFCVRMGHAEITSTSKFEEHAFVAMYFVALREQHPQAEGITAKFASILQRYASGDVLKLVANTPSETRFDFGAYFGVSRPLPPYYVFTITLRETDSIGPIRTVQALFEEEVADLLDLSATWIGVGERAVVLDQTENITFDPRRQPYKTI